MNEFESPTPASPNMDELKEQCAALRWQSVTLLIALLAVSGILTIYLYTQARIAKSDLETFRAQTSQLVEAYKKDEPVIKQFTARLAEFGKTHPDFAPILAKYQIAVATAATPTTSTPPAASAPKAAPTPKK